MNAACGGCTRNAVALKAPCTLTLNSGAPDALIKALPIDGRTMKEEEVKINDKMLKAVPEFCYLGDMLSAGFGC